MRMGVVISERSDALRPSFSICFLNSLGFAITAEKSRKIFMSVFLMSSYSFSSYFSKSRMSSSGSPEILAICSKSMRLPCQRSFMESCAGA